MKVNAGGRNGAVAPTCEADGPTEEGDPQGELTLGVELGWEGGGAGMLPLPTSLKGVTAAGADAGDGWPACVSSAGPRLRRRATSSLTLASMGLRFSSIV